jgi:hypothetical protein
MDSVAGHTRVLGRETRLNLIFTACDLMLHQYRLPNGISHVIQLRNTPTRRRRSSNALNVTRKAFGSRRPLHPILTNFVDFLSLFKIISRYQLYSLSESETRIFSMENVYRYFVSWPKNAQLFHKLSYSYMFRHYRVILMELVINILPSYTSISNAAVDITIYN